MQNLQERQQINYGTLCSCHTELDTANVDGNFEQFKMPLCVCAENVTVCNIKRRVVCQYMQG